MTHKVLRWEEPPPSRALGVRGKPEAATAWAHVAKDLEARTGEWAVVFEGASGAATRLAHAIRHGSLRPFVTYEFEAVARKVGDLTVAYARYVGDPEPGDLR